MPTSEPPEGSPRWGSPGDGPPAPGQRSSPPEPPRKKQWGRGCLWGCTGAVAAVIAIVVIVAVIAAGDGDEDTSPAPSTTPSAEPAQESQGERADLVSFQLDDRSVSGLTNIWVVWTIRNSSSKKSDYSWDWEAVDAAGTRLADGTQLETNVQPGQTAQGEFPTTLKTVKGVKLNITSFNRTASP